MEVGKMIQSYKITAVLDDVDMCMGGEIETKSGANEAVARLMCEELMYKYKDRVSNLKFYLEGKVIYEN